MVLVICRLWQTFAIAVVLETTAAEELIMLY